MMLMMVFFFVSFSRALRTAQTKLKTQQQMNAQLEEQRKKEEVSSCNPNS